MLEIFKYQFLQNAVLAGIFGGTICSVIGVFIFIKDIPFLGIALSHSAFAGALGALLLGFDPLAGALFFCFIASFILGPFSYTLHERTNTAIGVIFSAAVGLAFLWLGMIEGPKTEGLNLIWGSILTVSRKEVLLMAVTALSVAAGFIIYYPSLKAVMYNREIAASSGVRDKLIFYALILLCGIVISMNLTTIGGILIFSLLINPAAAAHRITLDLPWIFIFASIFGVASCMVGLAFSFWFNLPCGALIILTSSAIYLAVYILTMKKWGQPPVLSLITGKKING